MYAKHKYTFLGNICLLYLDVKSISQNSQVTTCATASFLLKLHGKETSVQLFSCEFCETFKNTFFIEHFRVTSYVGHGVVRDFLALLLIKDFKQY